MKNRKTIVVAFMLVAVMLLSVGYALVTNVLDVQGSVSVSATAAEKEFNKHIYFTGVVVNGELKPDGVTPTENLGYTANINANNNDKAQFTVTGIETTGQTQEITYRIKNESAYEAAVTLKSLSNTEDRIFDFDYYFGTPGLKSTTIASEGTVDVTVIVTLKKQVTSAAAASFILELYVSADDGDVATTEAPSEEVTEESVAEESVEENS